MKEYRKNRILREFGDFDRVKAKKLLSDFGEARKTLLPSKEYKDHLYSRLEALRYKQESTLELIKKYFSSALVFTFIVSGVWIFYTQNDFTGVPVSEDMSRGATSTRFTEDASEVMSMSDVGVRGVMHDTQIVSAWSDEDKELFQEICESSGAFLIEDEYICIVEMSDLCGLESLGTSQDNSCNIFFIGEKDEPYYYDEILPYQGQ